jgi:hypothetical protein
MVFDVVPAFFRQAVGKDFHRVEISKVWEKALTLTCGMIVEV